MNDDKRYTSGSSLEQTAKEEAVTRIEGELGDMTDELFIALKKLNAGQLAELLKLIRETKAELKQTPPAKKKS